MLEKMSNCGIFAWQFLPFAPLSPQRLSLQPLWLFPMLSSSNVLFTKLHPLNFRVLHLQASLVFICPHKSKNEVTRDLYSVPLLLLVALKAHWLLILNKNCCFYEFGTLPYLKVLMRFRNLSTFYKLIFCAISCTSVMCAVRQVLTRYIWKTLKTYHWNPPCGYRTLCLLD